MRALWIVRQNLTKHPGGDTTQILQTADALRRLGAHIDLTHNPKTPWNNYDLLHLFHLDRLWENLPICRQIRRRQTPTLLSTIYWPSTEFDKHGRRGVQGLLARTLGTTSYQTLRTLQRYLLATTREKRCHPPSPKLLNFNAAVRYVLNTVNILLPNSHAEAKAIQNQFNLSRPYVVVPNAANLDAFRNPPEKQSPTRAGVLCVGRLEPRKNQLALINALKNSNIPLTIVGQAGRFNKPYAKACYNAAGPNTQFLPQQPTHKLHQLYYAAKAHACVSWYETPGLASLEAALSGCAIIATPGGSTREYLGDHAHYADPAKPDSIHNAIRHALQAGPNPQLRHKIETQYTWQAAADQTMVAYERVLSGARRTPLESDAVS